MRPKGRAADQLRPVRIEPGFSEHSASVLFRMGQTVVHCAATVDESVPSFLEGSGMGWVTSEYALLPASTNKRSNRERGRIGGRTMEIQRLIGRSLRGMLNRKALGPRTLYLDCDVLNADGGTRCASVCGAYLALVLAVRRLEKKGLVQAREVLQGEVAAISVGLVGGEALLDLEYQEDSRADVDMNLVMTAEGKLIEIQGTAEQTPFSLDQLQQFLHLGSKGIEEILEAGRAFLAGPPSSATD